MLMRHDWSPVHLAFSPMPLTMSSLCRWGLVTGTLQGCAEAECHQLGEGLCSRSYWLPYTVSSLHHGALDENVSLSFPVCVCVCVYIYTHASLNTCVRTCVIVSQLYVHTVCCVYNCPWKKKIYIYIYICRPRVVCSINQIDW